ncbi:MAG: hypothetical protein QXY18_03675 [Nitrososphaerota archaeon]
MDLKLVLMHKDKILLEIPLSNEEWNKEKIEKEIENIMKEHEEIIKFFNIFSNKNRIKMFCKFLNDDDYCVNFAEFINEYRLNPKIVWDNMDRFLKIGFVKYEERGKYKLSEYGRMSFILTNIIYPRMLSILKEMCGEEENE